MLATFLTILLSAAYVPGQCSRQNFRASSEFEHLGPSADVEVDASKIMIPIPKNKLMLNGNTFKCCRNSETGKVILKDMAKTLPKEWSWCFDREGCGCMFGDHFHSYTDSCNVELSYLSLVTGETIEKLHSMAFGGGKRVTDVLPPAPYNCHAKRPPGIISVNMYCSRDQGFACEVFAVEFGFKVHITVWNSYGCGCSAPSFRAGSWSSTKRPNGPRIWTADTFVSGDGPTPKSLYENGTYVTKVFDGITYKYGAELDVDYSTMVRNIKTGNQPFTRSSISRIGKRVWHKGRQIYEIVEGDDIFILQAISQQVDPTLTDNSGLKNLLSRVLPKVDTFGNKVTGGGLSMLLPEGMTYRCKVLAEDLTIENYGEAVIMQDTFYNNYMLENIIATYSDEPCVDESEQWRLDYCTSTAQ